MYRYIAIMARFNENCYEWMVAILPFVASSIG